MNEADERDLSRRRLLKGGGAALAGLSVLQLAGPARGLPGHSDDETAQWDDERRLPRDDYPGHPDDEVIWWTDRPCVGVRG